VLKKDSRPYFESMICMFDLMMLLIYKVKLISILINKTISLILHKINTKTFGFSSIYNEIFLYNFKQIYNNLKKILNINALTVL